MSKIQKKTSYKLKSQKKLLITIDWLTLNCEDNFKILDFDENGIYNKGSFIYQKQEFSKTKHFNKMLRVYKDKNLIAVITYDSNNPKMLKDRCHIKFSNYLFYNNTLQQVVNELLKDNFIKNAKISRLDIAVDGVNFHGFLNKFLYKNNLKNVLRLRDSDNIIPAGFSRDMVKKHNFENFYIGQRGSRLLGTSKSSKFARYYNKTKELKDNGNKKPYINDYFKLNDFDLTKDIFRYEVELSSTYISTIKGFNLNDIFDKDYLISLLRQTNSNFFEFAYADNKNITRCTRIDMFKGFKKDTIYSRKKRVTLDSLRTIKVSVKRSITDCLTGVYSSNQAIKQAQNIISYVRQTLFSYDLKTWFSQAFEHIIFEQKIKARLQNLQLSDTRTNIDFWRSGNFKELETKLF